jgi:7-cyano-7-deazaguanine synthase
MSQVMLLSGGVDSAALALMMRPEVGLFVDYGQAAADAERRASQSVRSAIGIEWAELRIDCSAIGAGSLGKSPSQELFISPLWWPYRNLLITTFAGAWSLAHGAQEVLLGTVSTDANQHRDGTPWFVQSMDELLSGQEGAIRVRAPAIELTTEELCRRSGASLPFLARTYSCHTGSLPCGDCGGCLKRDEVLQALFPHA